MVIDSVTSPYVLIEDLLFGFFPKIGPHMLDVAASRASACELLSDTSITLRAVVSVVLRV